jgi:hypothetical protein
MRGIGSVDRLSPPASTHHKVTINGWSTTDGNLGPARRVAGLVTAVRVVMAVGC